MEDIFGSRPASYQTTNQSNFDHYGRQVRNPKPIPKRMTVEERQNARVRHVLVLIFIIVAIVLIILGATGQFSKKKSDPFMPAQENLIYVNNHI
jgi:hypothetical protein